MNINLKVWRQKSGAKKGSTKTYRLENIDPNISFLEMLDILNIKLVKEKKTPLLLIMTVEREFVVLVVS